MRRQVKKTITANRLLLSLAFLLVATNAAAAPVCLGTLDTWLGNICTVDGVTFDFSAGVGIYTVSSNLTAPASTINVTTSQGPGFVTLTFTPQSNTEWEISQSGSGALSADVNIGFNASMAAPGFTGAEFDVTGVVVRGSVQIAGISAGEQVCDLSNNCFPSMSSNIQSTTPPGGTTAVSRLVISPRMTPLVFDKDLALSTSVNGDKAQILSVTEGFSLFTPEPGVIVLTASGIAGLLLFRRRAARAGSKFLALAGVLILTAGGAHAFPMCISGNTLDTYLNNTCQAGLVNFDITAYSDSPGGGPGGAQVPANQIVVNVLANNTLQFTGTAWNVSGAGPTADTIEFIMTVGPANPIQGLSQYNTNVTTSFSGNGQLAAGSQGTINPYGGTITYPAGGGGGAVALVPPQTGAQTIDEKIILSAPGASDSAHLSSIKTGLQVVTIPEPLTVALIGSGLLLVGFAGKKMRRR